VAASVALALASVLASGCTVTTRIAVYETAPGAGSLSVSVDFDAATVTSLGGPAVLARELDVADLRSAGWTVTGPVGGSTAGHEVVTASHPFSSEAQLSDLAASLAGTGPAAGRPFHLTLTTSRSFWHTVYRLNGTADLRCGLDCFGDSALKKATGSTVGLPVPAGSAPELQFLVTARLPGSPDPGPGASVPAGGLFSWQPQLGQLTSLSAQSSRWNRSSVEEAVAAGAALAVVLLALAVWSALRWRRRRARRREGGRGRHFRRD
jgi:hypothetical protein